jgi:hypothetical protein
VFKNLRSFVANNNLDTSENSDKYLESLEMWCCRSITKNQGRNEYPTYIKKRKINCVGNIMRKNDLLKHVIEGQIEGKIGLTGRRGGRRNNLWMIFRKGRLLEIQKGGTRWQCI